MTQRRNPQKLAARWAKLSLGLLMIGIGGAACSPHSDDSPDLGNASSDGSSMDAAVEAPTFSMLGLVAGGLGAVGDTDGTGSAARFRFPLGMATDGAGNLYVADGQNHTIRKVVLKTGEVTTLAGTAGISGGRDGAGAVAQFNGPVAVAADGAGNLYVADSQNHTIRKVVLASREVSTLAGTSGVYGNANGVGSSARFHAPEGLAADGAGNLYVADTWNATIRKLVLATGEVSTLAGIVNGYGHVDGKSSLAQFRGPAGLATDGAGNLYVADSQNSTIRKIVLATGDVSTLAGLAPMQGSADGTGAAARFNFPSAVVADGAGNLYVADRWNATIRKVVVATGEVSTLAGTAGMYGSADGAGPAAQFNQPFAVAVDGAGDLLVADSFNCIIRKVVLATSVVSTLAGPAGLTGHADGTASSSRFLDPHGVAADGNGNLYIADTGNGTIRKVVLATGEVSTLAGTAGLYGSADGIGAAARFSSPQGMATDGAGNLYVANSGNGTIRKVVLATGEVSTLAGTAGMYGSADGKGFLAQFNAPQSLAVDGAGNLYIADTGNSTIRKLVLATGEVSTLAGTAGMWGSTDGIGAAVRFGSPQGVVADHAGNLYVADTYSNTIRKLVLTTGEVSTLVGNADVSGGSADGIGADARFYRPVGMTVDGAGNLYVADEWNATIRKVVLASRLVTTLIGAAPEAGMVGMTDIKLGPIPARLNNPVDVAMLHTGELIIIDSTWSVVLEAH